MPVNNKLGTASISVEADVSGFGKELSAKLKAALSVADREAKAAGKRLGKQIVDGIGDEVLRQTPLLRRRINAMLRGITVKAKVKLDVDVDQGRTSVSGLAARLRGQVEGEALGPLKSLQNMLGGLANGLMPKSLQQLGLMVSIGAILGDVLAGAFNATGRELLNVVKLAGFLPAALAVVGTVIGTVQIGILGVGDAIEAVFSKDPEKIKAALKDLAPSAQSFVREIQAAIPILERIKYGIQESLFAPLKGQFTELLSSVGAIANRGLSAVAGSIGNLLAQVAGVFSSPNTQDFLRNLFASTASIITSLSGPISNLLNALVNVANAALPSLVNVIGSGLAGFIQKVADWLNKVVADGSFQEFLDSALRTLSDVWYVIKELALLFAVLFDDANLEGKSFLEVVGDMIADFRDFAASNDGKLALQGIATVAKLAGVALLGIIVTIGTLIAAVGSFVGAVQRAIGWVKDLINAIRAINREKEGISNPLRNLQVPARAAGAIVRSPEVALIGEAGPEVVIPLNRPNRARQLAEQSGLTGMLGGSGTTIQKFYLGTEEVDARIVTISSDQINRSVNDATTGARAA